MNERVVYILKSPWTTHVSIAVIATGVGVGLGYILWGREPKYVVAVPADDPQLEFEFDTKGLADVMPFVDKEFLAESQDIIASNYGPGGIYIPETDAEVIDDSVVVRPSTFEEDYKNEAFYKVAMDVDKSKLIEVNVFEQDVEWDWEVEVESRNPEKPYILHRDEFYRNEHDYSQSSLTYYRGDNIMADENDGLVFNYLKLTGPLLFGHGSGDPNVVLIRNDKRRAEYEVSVDEGRFEVEVLGLEYEEHEAEKNLKHSKISKFRPD